MYPVHTSQQYRAGQVYTPEDLALFRTVFEESEMVLPAALRSLLASRILDCAAAGG